MYKVEYVDEKDIKLDYLEESIHFNHMPKPFKEISFEEYMNILDEYSPKYYTYHQVTDDYGYKMLTGENWTCHSYVTVNCCFFSEFGLARAKINDAYRYYKLGCEHEWELISTDVFENTFKCKKCGTSTKTYN